MFGLRRHVAVAAAPEAPVPQLADAQIFELVHGKVAELMGEHGEWTVSRRCPDDTDDIFHAVLAQSVSVSIAAVIIEARRLVEAGESVVSAPQHRASDPADVIVEPVVDQDENDENEEPAALSWEPAPITVWTDLRKPVTGEIAAVVERAAA